MRFLFTEAIILSFITAVFSCAPGDVESREVIDPLEFHVTDSILGTCSSISAGEGGFLAVFDALSKQYLNGYEWRGGDSLEFINRGHIVRDRYNVRDIKYFEGKFYVVEGTDGVLIVERNGGFEAVGRIISPDTGTMFFDVAVRGDEAFCACGESGVLVFRKRPGIGQAVSYSLANRLNLNGSASHVCAFGDIIAAGLWDMKKVCVFVGGELKATIENLPGIAGLATDGEKLFIAAEQGGLMIYDLTEGKCGDFIRAVSDAPAYDVELSENYVFVASDIDGLNVYDKKGDLVAFCRESSPAEKVSVDGGIIFVSHAKKIPTGYLWIIKAEGL